LENGNPVPTESGSKLVATTFQFLVTPSQQITPLQGQVQVAKDYAAWQQDTVKYAQRPMFYAMNVIEPPQYNAINKPVDDTIKDVIYGRKPISAYTDAVAAWRTAGGDALRTFYDDIRNKYGTGQ
jgi:putative aldouronate transport system substrate-binding protein